MKVFQVSAAFLVSLAMSACGGGGGSEGTSPFVKAASSPAVSAPTLVLAISSPSPTASAPSTVTATVKDATGSPASGKVVFFFAPVSLGTFTPDTSLTDVSGNAFSQLSPAAGTAGGAGNVTATTNVNSVVLSQTIGFQVAAP